MNAHKKQQDKVFETEFIDSQKSDHPFAHLLALTWLSHVWYTTKLDSFKPKHGSDKTFGIQIKHNQLWPGGGGEGGAKISARK